MKKIDITSVRTYKSSKSRDERHYMKQSLLRILTIFLTLFFAAQAHATLGYNCRLATEGEDAIPSFFLDLDNLTHKGAVTVRGQNVPVWLNAKIVFADTIRSEDGRVVRIFTDLLLFNGKPLAISGTMIDNGWKIKGYWATYHVDKSGNYVLEDSKVPNYDGKAFICESVPGSPGMTGSN